MLNNYSPSDRSRPPNRASVPAVLRSKAAVPRAAANTVSFSGLAPQRNLHSLVPMLLILLLVPGIARAQIVPQAGREREAGVVLRARPPVARGIASLPALIGTGPVVARINHGLDAVERNLLNAMHDCKTQARSSKSTFGWTRTVQVTANGPRMLSFLVQDDTSCGGAYPDTDRLALVYDLQSGRPVDWLALLPTGFAASSTVSKGVGGSQEGLVTSPSIMALYRRHYPVDVPDVDRSMRNECRDSVQEGFTIWPDTTAHALMIQPTAANHAAAACAVAVKLTVPMLKQADTAAALLDALKLE